MSSEHWALHDFFFALKSSDRDAAGLDVGQTILVAVVSCLLGIFLGAGLFWLLRRPASARTWSHQGSGRGRAPADDVERQVGTLSELAQLNAHHRRLRHHSKSSKDRDNPEDSETSEVESYYSCNGEELEQAIAPHRETRLNVASLESVGRLDSTRPKRPRQNANLVTQYQWLQGLIQSIVDGTGSLTGCRNAETGQSCMPLFVVAGVCPSSFPPSPMQAVLFSQSGGKLIDFWFVKPEASNPSVLERATLSKNSKGGHKNNAERSRNLYNPLAEKFSGRTDGDCVYGVDARGRAFVEEKSPGRTRRMLVYFVWIENWSSGMTGKKFLEGKICYERVASGSIKNGRSPFYARQYRIEDGSICLAPRAEEDNLPCMMPAEDFQEMY